MTNDNKMDISSNPYFGEVISDVLDASNGEKQAQGEYLEEHIIEKVKKIAENALKELAKESLLPLPANYQMCFERLLEKEDASFRQKIQALIDLQSLSQDRIILFEKSVKEGFLNIKKMLEVVTNVYKGIQFTKNVSEKYTKDLSNIDNKLAFNNTMQLLLKDLSRMQEKSSTQLEQLKDAYQKTANAMNNINENTIYDSRFDVYNKRYFVSLIGKEGGLIQELSHESSIITLSLSNKMLKNVRDKAMMLVLLKSIAKLLLKTSRRSDILAYLGDGIFAMGLRYSSLQSATKAAQRLLEIAKTTDVFFNGKDASLDLAIGIAKILPERSAEGNIESSLTALKVALNEGAEYRIYAQDEVKDNGNT